MCAALYYVATHELSDTPVLLAIVDVGQRFSAVSIVRLTKMVAEVSDNVGGEMLDSALVSHVSPSLKKHGVDLSSNVKARLKTARQCEKLKKMLGTVPEAEMTVDNVADGVDFLEKATRVELETLAEPFLQRLSALVSRAITEAAVSAADLSAVEVIGNGWRVPCVRECLVKAFQRDLSFTMDGASAVASGAAVAARIAGGQSNIQASIPLAAELSEGDEPDLQRMKDAEQKMSEEDAKVHLAGVRKNELESFMFELREYLHGVLKDTLSAEDQARALDACQTTEHSLWDVEHNAPAEVYEQLLQHLRSELPPAVLQQRDAYIERRAAERAEEERKAAAQREAELASRRAGVATSARMKEKGNNLFKSGQYEEAREAYIRALNGFLGLELERKEQAEADQIKLTCYLNLCVCGAKLNMHDEVITNATRALDIDAKSAKAYYRRSCAYLAKKDFEKAEKDLNKAAELQAPEADIKIARARLQQAVDAEKQREKRMYQGMFR